MEGTVKSKRGVSTPEVLGAEAVTVQFIGQTGPLFICVNRVSLEHSHIHLLHVVYGCFCTRTEVSVGTEKVWPTKSEIFPHWPFPENVADSH